MLALVRKAHEGSWDDGAEYLHSPTDVTAALIAAGYVKPRVITGISELNVLSSDAVLEHGIRRMWPGEPAGLEWGMSGDSSGHSVHEIPLPIRLMFSDETPA